MTNTRLKLKFFISLVVAGLVMLSLLLWSQTPQLFKYFNQAFCAH